jgi:hypothetical protein
VISAAIDVVKLTEIYSNQMRNASMQLIFSTEYISIIEQTLRGGLGSYSQVDISEFINYSLHTGS